jgi:hypothetical protein
MGQQQRDAGPTLSRDAVPLVACFLAQRRVWQPARRASKPLPNTQVPSFPCSLSCPALQDIEPTWESILKLLDYNTGLARFARPGGWNDLDMLEGRLGRGRVGRLVGCWDLAAVSALLLAVLLQRIQACTEEQAFYNLHFRSCSGEWQADGGGAARPLCTVGAAQVAAADWR